MTRRYRRNIYCLYVIKLAKWLMLIMPIAALFYNRNGLDYGDIFILQAVYSVGVAAMEIPSGYMADVLGRKRTLVLGSILGSLGYLAYSLSSGLYSFMLAEIILGLGASFISGADSAMLFDSLAADDQHQRYLQYEGRITSLGNFAETAAALCGGILAAILSYRAVYFCQALIAATAIPAAILLSEPPRDSLPWRPGMRHLLAICRKSLVSDKALRNAILVSGFTGIGTLSMAWCAQVFFVDSGLTELQITPLWIALNLTVALFAAYAEKVRTFLGETTALLLIIILLPASFILLGLFPLLPALLVLFVFYAIRGYATPVLKDLINKCCDSATRATVLSIRSLFIRCGFAIFGPFIGIMARQADLRPALIIGGVLLLLFTAFSGYLLFTGPSRPSR